MQTEPTNQQPAPHSKGKLVLFFAGSLSALWLAKATPAYLSLFANLLHLCAGASLVAALFFSWKRWPALLRRVRPALLSFGLVGLTLTVWPWVQAPASAASEYRDAEPFPVATELRVISYNLGSHLTQHERLAEGLLAAEADVICLQELVGRNATHLHEALAETHPHQIAYPGRIHGRGLFSRYPIISHEYLELAQERKHLIAKLDVEGQIVTVLSLHIALQVSLVGDTCAGGRDLNNLLERYPASAGPTIYCGDYNCTERSSLHKSMRQADFDDSFRSAGRGPGFTFPYEDRYRFLRGSPTCVRIDYIWNSPHLRATASRVGPDLGSDHLPVISDFQLTR